MERPLDLEMTQKAAELIIEKRTASTSLIQRYLKLGYNRACHIMNNLEAAKVVGKANGGKPRKLFVSHKDDAFSLLKSHFIGYQNETVIDETIQVYSFSKLGKKLVYKEILDLLSVIQTESQETDSSDFPLEIELSKYEMKESEFNNLPEFTGY